MYSKYFGLYLLGKGLLTKDQFFDITEKPDLASVDFTEHTPEILTFSEGFKELHEAAVSAKKLITAILDKNLMSSEEIEQAIADYEKECSVIEDQAAGFQGLDYEIIVRILLDSSKITNEKMQDFFYNYIALLLTNIAKYLNDEPAIWTNYRVEGNLPQIDRYKCWLVSQSVTFNNVCTTAYLLMHQDLLVKIAERYSQEKLSTVNALVLDAVSEFFNFNNGLFVTNLTNAGIEAEIALPKIVQDYPTLLELGYVVPIGLKDGQMYLILSND